MSTGSRSDVLVAISGQGPLDLETGVVVDDTGSGQTSGTLDHVDSVFEAAELGLEDVIKVTVFLADTAYDGEFSNAYVASFDEPYPARSCLVTGLLDDIMTVEIETGAQA